MGEAAERLDPYEALRALPEHQVGEVLGGALHVQPRPSPRHVRSQGVLGSLLGGAYDWGGGDGGPGGWWILPEPELHLGADVMVPDLAGWRRSRLPRLPESAHVEVVPDWVCEVASPSTARLDRAVKMPAYARHGVEHLWLLDPQARTLEVYRRQGEGEGARWLLLATLQGSEAVRQPPFEEAAFALSRLWPEPEEPAGEEPPAGAGG